MVFSLMPMPASVDGGSYYRSMMTFPINSSLNLHNLGACFLTNLIHIRFCYEHLHAGFAKTCNLTIRYKNLIFYLWCTLYLSPLCYLQQQHKEVLKRLGLLAPPPPPLLALPNDPPRLFSLETSGESIVSTPARKFPPRHGNDQRRSNSRRHRKAGNEMVSSWKFCWRNLQFFFLPIHKPIIAGLEDDSRSVVALFHKNYSPFPSLLILILISFAFCNSLFKLFFLYIKYSPIIIIIITNTYGIPPKSSW